MELAACFDEGHYDGSYMELMVGHLLVAERWRAACPRFFVAVVAAIGADLCDFKVAEETHLPIQARQLGVIASEGLRGDARSDCVRPQTQLSSPLVAVIGFACFAPGLPAASPAAFDDGTGCAAAESADAAAGAGLRRGQHQACWARAARRLAQPAPFSEAHPIYAQIGEQE